MLKDYPHSGSHNKSCTFDTVLTRANCQAAFKRLHSASLQALHRYLSCWNALLGADNLSGRNEASAYNQVASNSKKVCTYLHHNLKEAMLTSS